MEYFSTNQKPQSSHPIEGLILGFVIFSIVGFILYFSDFISNDSREPASIPQRSLMSTFLLPQTRPSEEAGFDLKKLAPTNLRRSDSQDTLIAKIADKGINSILSSKKFKQTAAGHLTEDVKKSMKTEVKTQSHKFSAGVDAIQGQANLNYKGPIDADLQLAFKQSKYTLELRENIDPVTQVYIRKDQYKSEYLNTLGMRWSW